MYAHNLETDRLIRHRFMGPDILHSWYTPRVCTRSYLAIILATNVHLATNYNLVSVLWSTSYLLY